MSADLFLRALRSACEAAGSARVWAERHHVSHSSVTHALNGTVRAPNPKLLAAMRWRKIVTYEPMGEKP